MSAKTAPRIRLPRSWNKHVRCGGPAISHGPFGWTESSIKPPDGVPEIRWTITPASHSSSFRSAARNELVPFFASVFSLTKIATMAETRSPLESQLTNARESFATGRYDAAVDLIEGTAAKHANNASSLLQCARSFGNCYEIQRAEELLERLLTIVPLEAHPAIAMVFQQIFRPNRAVSIFEDLRSNGKLSLPNLALLAKLYEQSNQLQEAIDALSLCIDGAPTQPQPKVLLARLHRQMGNLLEAENLLTAVVAADAPHATMVHAWSELTLIHDKQGDYSRAIVAIENAKSMLRSMPQVKQQARRSSAINVAFQQLYAELESSTLDRWAAETLAPVDSAGVAHLIGFPRSGTTLLEQMLDAHPAIHCAPERVVFTKSIFPQMCRSGALSIDALDSCSPDQINDLRSRYVRWHAAIVGQSLSGVTLLDKNPNHTSLLIGLFRLFPESKFVFALRDPRDVVVSTYMRFFSLSEFSASYLTWESTCELYAHEMNVWLKVRSLLQGNWTEVKYEDTVSDPKKTTNKATEVLGVPWHEGMENYRDDAQKFVYSPTHAEVRRPIYKSSIGRWQDYKQYLAPHLEKLAPFVEAFGYDV